MRNRAQNDAIGAFRPRNHVVRDGGPGGLERIESDRRRLKDKLKPEQAVCRTQHVDGGGDDLRPDAVAREHQKAGCIAMRSMVTWFGAI